MNIVFFLTLDRVGKSILAKLNELNPLDTHVVLHNPSADFFNASIPISSHINVLNVFENSPNWEDLLRLLPNDVVLRGFSWFPFLFPDYFIARFNEGMLNLHNSFLPFNRGRHSTFWAIMDRTPFGATIHWVDARIDRGNIVTQKQIILDEYANASEAYEAQLDICIELALDFLPSLQGKIDIGISQNDDLATLHLATDIIKATTVSSKDWVTWGDVVKLIRATSTPKGSISVVFEDGNRVVIAGSVIGVSRNLN